MTSTTTRHLITRHDDVDPLSDIGLNLRTALNRIDLLAGEVGTNSITPSAVDTTTSKRINYARSYAALAAIPKAFVFTDAAAASSTTNNWWVTDEDSTGFTVNVRSTTTSLKQFRYMVRPA